MTYLDLLTVVTTTTPLFLSKVVAQFELHIKFVFQIIIIIKCSDLSNTSLTRFCTVTWLHEYALSLNEYLLQHSLENWALFDRVRLNDVWMWKIKRPHWFSHILTLLLILLFPPNASGNSFRREKIYSES